MKRTITLILALAVLIGALPLIDFSVFAATKYEYALFPMRYLNISQGVNTGTHIKYNAIDLTGQDTGCDNVRAPYTGIVKRKYTKYGNVIWFQSQNKVYFADGTLDYMTMLLMHDNDISNLNEGDIIKQGEVFYQEGSEGITSGNHVHMEVARGRTTSWYLASTSTFQGQEVENWALTGNIEPWKALHLGQIIPGKDTIVKEDKGYKWVTLKAHTVTFTQENGEVLATEYVYDGDDAVYTGATPTKSPENDVHYSFAGWDKSLTKITANTTFVAQFDAVPHSFTYSRIDDNEHSGECSCGYTTINNHLWAEGEMIEWPGCESQGSVIYICADCEATKADIIPAFGHVYEYEDEGATHHVVCGQCNEAYYEAHSFVDGVCVCGAVEYIAPVVDENIVINHTLNLASDISVSYVVVGEYLEGYEDYYLEVKVPNYEGNEKLGNEIVKIEPVVSGSYIYFTLTGVTAVQMNDELLATLYMTKDGKSYVSNEDVYSIATYAYNQLNKATAAQSLKKLCADLLCYGAATQSYKGYRTDALVTENMTAAHKAYMSNTDAVTFGNTNTIYNDVTSPLITWVGKTLNLDSKVIVRFVFDASAYTGNINNLTLKLVYQDSDGIYQEMTLTNPKVYNAGKRQYAFDFDGLMAAELRTAISAAVYAGDMQMSQTLRYSPDAYGNNKTGALLTVCKALFAYSDSAKAYFSN